MAKGRLAHVEPGDTAEHLDEAVDALGRMEELVDDLLDLARDGRDIDTTESVDVADTARSAWNSVEAPASALRVDVAESVTADGGRLTQLFGNLFRNSIEHGGDPENGHSPAEVTVTVGAMDDGFYVADDGPGIPESEREDVFETGYSTNEDGTGFGLDIVREIVDAHGWTVAVTESKSGGARFEITGVAADDG